MATQSIRPGVRNNPEALSRATTGLSNYPTVTADSSQKVFQSPRLNPARMSSLTPIESIRPPSSPW